MPSTTSASMFFGLTFFVCAIAHPASAQLVADFEPAPAQQYEFDLSLRNIMRGSEHVGEAPQNVRWTDDGESIFFEWRPGGGEWSDQRSWYRFDGGEPEKLEEAEAEELMVMHSPGDLSPDRAWRVTSVDGDLYLVDRGSMEARPLTATVATETQPTFSGDGSEVFFQRDSNLFGVSLGSGLVRQVTDLREGPEPDEDDEAEGHREFLEDQQEELFENIRLKLEREAETDAREDRADARRPDPFYRDARERVAGLYPAPGGDFVAVVFSTPAFESRETLVPDWVTESGYTEELNVRTKVGDGESSLRIGIVESATGEMTFLDLAERIEEDGPRGSSPDSGHAGGSGAGATSDSDTGTGETESDHEEADNNSDSDRQPDLAQLTFAGWNDAGTHGIVFAVDYDYKDWRLYSVEASSGALTLLDTLHDEAWVGGPCFSGPRSGAGGPSGCVGWIPGRDRIYYVSEETGWAQLYAIDADGTDKQALTSGEWEIHSVKLPEDRSHFLLQTGERSPFDRHLYRMDFDGGDREILFEGEGRFEGFLSPDGDRVAVLWARSNRPNELFLGDYAPGAEIEQVTQSPTEEWLSYPWIEPEIVRFGADDGTQVPARIYRPADFGVSSNGAGVVFVHGAGYTQNVHHGWSGYYREYMFHHFLASQGYTVLDIDYRGSAGHGRDWRTAVYRWMGGKDLSDQVDGVRFLVDQEGIDASRIGIYGGSYGGFITLMALFTEPDVFEAGAALRSVTDWAHYNHWYTSRILNQPQDDNEAYEKSSPIYFAEGFRGHLLMAHGMVDTNVHFSDVVRLAQRLIELGKENWEMAVYPVEPHGFQEPSSWVDEYRRIFELFDRTIGGARH